MSIKPVYFLHLLGAVSFVLVPLLLAPQPIGHPRFVLDPPTVRDLVGNTLMLGFFYLNYYLLIPRFFLTGKYLLYASILLFALASIVLLPTWMTSHPFYHSLVGRPFPHFQDRIHESLVPVPGIVDFVRSINHLLLLYVVVVLFSILLRIREQWQLTENAKSQAEILSLKNQINPHFLFNVLNAVYGLALKEKAAQTSESILRVSDMMRYVVTEASSDVVPLANELQYLDNYIRLQKLRLSPKTNLSVTQSGESAGLYIAPLILMPFVENAFKHGVNPEEEGEIQIRISMQENRLELYVHNRVFQANLARHEVSGKGMANTMTRLELVYPSRYKLGVENDGNQYKVNLKLQL